MDVSIEVDKTIKCAIDNTDCWWRVGEVVVN